MATPIFKPIQGHAAPVSVPRALETALFVHRIKQQYKPRKDPALLHANGHPIIHQPIVVRPARPTHQSSTQVY